MPQCCVTCNLNAILRAAHKGIDAGLFCGSAAFLDEVVLATGAMNKATGTMNKVAGNIAMTDALALCRALGSTEQCRHTLISLHKIHTSLVA